MRGFLTRGFLAAALAVLLAATGFAAGSQDKPAAAAGGGKLLAEPVTFRWMQQEDESQPLKNDSPAVREVFNKTNVKLVFEPVPQVNYDEKKNALLATNQLPDFARVGARDIQLYAASGVFVPVSDYMQYLPDFKKEIDKRPDVNMLKVGGKLYGFPVMEYWRIGVAPMPTIRADLLDKLKIPRPTTFDELYDALVKIKAAYPDTIGVSVRNGTKYLLGQWSFPLGSGGFPGFLKSGQYLEPTLKKYVHAPTSEDFKLVVQYLSRLYKAGLLDKDYAINKADQFYAKMTAGKAVFAWDNSTFSGRVYNPGLAKIDPNAKFDILDPLKNAKGQVRAYRYQRDWLNTDHVVNAKLDENKRVAAMKFFNWMYSSEGMLSTNFGTLGETYDMIDGQPKIKQSIVDKFAGRQDQFNAIQAEVGIGLQAFALFVHEKTLSELSLPEVVAHGKRVDALTDKGSVIYISYDPPFSAAETEVYKKVEPAVDTIFSKGIDKFITGERPLSEYDAFRQEMIKAGAPEIERIFNDAYKRMMQ